MYLNLQLRFCVTIAASKFHGIGSSKSFPDHFRTRNMNSRWHSMHSRWHSMRSGSNGCVSIFPSCGYFIQSFKLCKIKKKCFFRKKILATPKLLVSFLHSFRSLTGFSCNNLLHQALFKYGLLGLLFLVWKGFWRGSTALWMYWIDPMDHHSRGEMAQFLFPNWMNLCMMGGKVAEPWDFQLLSGFVSLVFPNAKHEKLRIFPLWYKV